MALPTGVRKDLTLRQNQWQQYENETFLQCDSMTKRNQITTLTDIHNTLI